MDAREQAIIELQALVQVPGALRIITNIPDPDGAELPVQDPRHWVQHPVERLDGPNAKGLYTAVSGEYNAAEYGYNDRLTHDECTGQPEALLMRLREWRG